MFKDAGYDLSKWYFDLEITKRQATIEELDQACKTAIEIEDYEKAAKIRDIINSKKDDGKDKAV